MRLDVLGEHLSLLRFVIEEASAVGASRVEVTMREEARSLAEVLRSAGADVGFGRAGAVVAEASRTADSSVVPVDAETWPADLERGTPVLEPICALVGPAHPWADGAPRALRELAGQDVWFPTTGAPREWIDLLDELADDLGLEIDTAGSTMGFAHFAAQLSDGRPLVTFLGGAMTAPPPTVVVPLLDPVPVFPWTPVWRAGAPAVVRQLAVAVVARARAAVPEPHTDEAWLPAVDRALLPDTSPPPDAANGRSRCREPWRGRGTRIAPDGAPVSSGSVVHVRD